MKLTKIATDILLFSLLAVFCVGAMELLFCYHADPELFDQIIFPFSTKTDTTASGSDDVTISQNPVPLADDISQIATTPSLLREDEAADPSVTLLITGKYGTVLTGGSFPITYYNQADEAWAGSPFGTDLVGEYGCGPTAMAMVVSSMTETSMNPTTMAAWAAEQGYSAAGSGSYHSIVQGTAKCFGLNCESLGQINADQLREKLSSGGVIVALMGKGHFTNSGHFIILHGTTATGEILVADPNSRENSVMTWDAQLILDELAEATDDGAPLWLITA